MLRLATFCFGLFLSACGSPQVQGDQTPKLRVVSLDYCADQYVLKFVPRDNILAVSPEANKTFSYMRDAATGVRIVRPVAEDVLALKPDLIVRSHGGGPNAANWFRQAGIPVVSIAWAQNVTDIKTVIADVSDKLGARDKGLAVIADMDTRLAALSARPSPATALYLSSGGVTAGQGGLTDEMFALAGLTNFSTSDKWLSVDLEALTRDRPDLFAYVAFDHHINPWSGAAHPVAKRAMQDTPLARIEGALTSCPAWFFVDAVEVLAEAGQ